MAKNKKFIHYSFKLLFGWKINFEKSVLVYLGAAEIRLTGCTNVLNCELQRLHNIKVLICMMLS